MRILELSILLFWLLKPSFDIFKDTSVGKYDNLLIQDPFNEIPHPRIRWTNPNNLIPHENTSKPHLDNLIDHLLTLPLTSVVPIPVVTTTKPRVILDGHHRVAASIHLEIEMIPVWEVDDTDEILNWEHTRIRVYSRSDGIRIRLQDVVSSAREGKVAFGIKGTRHVAILGPEHLELPLERVTPRVKWGQWISSGKDFSENGHPVLIADD